MATENTPDKPTAETPEQPSDIGNRTPEFKPSDSIEEQAVRESEVLKTFEWGDDEEEKPEKAEKKPKAEKPKATADTKAKDDADTPEADEAEESEEPEVEVPDEYLVDEDDADTEDADVAEKLREANRGITKKFAKLDADYKKKVAALDERETALRARESAADELEPLFLETLSGEKNIKDVDLGKLIDLHPKGKELRKEFENLHSEVDRLRGLLIGQDVKHHMHGLGYSDSEIAERFKDAAQVERLHRLVANGESIEDVLRVMRIRDKRRSVHLPKPVGTEKVNPTVPIEKQFKWGEGK